MGEGLNISSAGERERVIVGMVLASGTKDGCSGIKGKWDTLLVLIEEKAE